MSFIPVEIEPYLRYAALPLLGTISGYFISKMTTTLLCKSEKGIKSRISTQRDSGVNSKINLNFAKVIGEMVGDTVISSEEIRISLQKEQYQQRLLGVIEEHVGALMHTDLRALPTLIPERFGTYFELAVKTIKYQIKESIHTYIHSDIFIKKVSEMIDGRVEQMLEEKAGKIAPDIKVEKINQLINVLSENILNNQAASLLIKKHVGKAVCQALEKNEISTDNDALSSYVSQSMLELSANPEISGAISSVMVELLMQKLNDTKTTVGLMLTQLAGEGRLVYIRSLIISECQVFLRSRQTVQALDLAVEALIDALLEKNIGKLSNFLPTGVRDSIARFIHTLASDMLEQEVPYLVQSLQLSRIVKKRILSLAPGRVENLFLEIVKKSSRKYVPLYGALLGFVFGCINMAILYI